MNLPIKKTEWVIIAGGESVQSSDIDLVKDWRSKDPSTRGVIAVTRSYELAPWADIVHARDKRFWTHYYNDVKEKTSAILTCWQDCSHLGSDLNHLDLDKIDEGGNSGYQAILIAMACGAKNIYLLGFDMHHKKKTHWHGGYPDGLGNSLAKLGTMGSVFRTWIQKIEKLDHQGVRIVNCSMISKLNRFPKQPIEECL